MVFLHSCLVFYLSRTVLTWIRESYMHDKLKDRWVAVFCTFSFVER